MKLVLIWILSSVVLAIAISLVALVFDYLAEKGAKNEKTRTVVRRVLLLETSARIADSIDQMNLQQVAGIGALAVCVSLVAYFAVPMVGSLFVASFFRYLFWIIIVVAAGAAIYVYKAKA